VLFELDLVSILDNGGGFKYQSNTAVGSCSRRANTIIGTVKVFTVDAISNKIDFTTKHIAKLNITTQVVAMSWKYSLSFEDL